MALFRAHFFSQTLRLSCSADVILPDQRKDPARPLACLWLLHGLSDDHTTWQRRTSIERYAAAYRLAVVMPAVDRSFCADMRYGLPYWTYLSEELPVLMRQYFPLSARRADNFVAGNSMGGYGAFKLALNLPERYAAAASLSGALILTTRRFLTRRREILKLAFGGSPKGTNSDLLHAVAKLARSRRSRPRLYQCCGTEEELLADNRLFRDRVRQAGLKVDYVECPGRHEWGFWDDRIQDALAWLRAERA